jgi:hypothetical protein
MKKLLILFLWLVGVLAYSQSTYYVDDDAVNDLGVGSFADPFKTITHGESHLAGGDTLYIRGGTYQEIVTISGINGTSGARTVISGYLNEDVNIDGNNTLPGTLYAYLVRLQSTYTTLQKVDIINSLDAGLSITGNYSYGLYVDLSHIGESGMVLACTEGMFDHCTCTDNGYGYITGGGGRYATWGSAICTGGSAAVNCIIQNCISHDNKGEGFNAYNNSNGTIIRNNVAYDNYSQNLYLDGSSNCQYYGNLVYNTKTNLSGNGMSGGIVVAKERSVNATNNIIYNNCVFNTLVNFWIDSNVTDLVGLTVVNNTFINAYGNWANGYRMGVYFNSNVSNYSSSIFKNNIIIEDSVAGRYPITVETSHTGLTFDNNLWNEAPDVDAVGVNDVIGDPKIRKGPVVAGSLTGLYFDIKALSAAIDEGTSVGINTDYSGALRNATPDIGAWEGESPPPPSLGSVVTGGVSAWVRWAIATGNVTSDGDGTISALGVCWNTSINPTVSNSHTHDGTTEGIFTSSITGLLPSTIYYLRSYVTNQIGTAYGSEIVFTTPKYTALKNGTKVLVSGGKVLVIK